MRKRNLLVVVSIVGIATLFIVGSIFAAGKAPDIIKMQNKAYEKHTKGIVEFSHKKHMDDYAKKSPEFYKNKCGECHHDDKGKALAGLKDGDPVKSCTECHKKPGEKPKGKDAPKLTKQQELEYHAEAIHDNCRGCHKNFNKKTNSKAAPETCAKCHPGKEK